MVSFSGNFGDPEDDVPMEMLLTIVGEMQENIKVLENNQKILHEEVQLNRGGLQELATVMSSLNENIHKIGTYLKLDITED